jgi:hypothetical protein
LALDLCSPLSRGQVYTCESRCRGDISAFCFPTEILIAVGMDIAVVHHETKTYRKVEMMMSDRIFSLIGLTTICLLLLMMSCGRLAEGPAAPKIEHQETTSAVVSPAEKSIKPKVEPKEQVPQTPAAEAVALALKFTPQDSTTYRVILEADRSVTWEGPLPEKPAAFKGGHTGNKIEITFTQRIQRVDDKGNATAEITIEGLKYLAKVKDNITLDFDSSQNKDPNTAFAKLIGQSYTVEISPAGQVTKVIDVSKAQATVKGSSAAHSAAVAFLSADAIKQRHSIPAMPPADKNQLRPGDSWSSIQAFDFGMMGSKSYEKTYRLKEINGADNRQVAVVEMDAIPSAEMAAELHKEQATGPFSKMFDNTEIYTGKLSLDLTAGKVEECSEKLLSEWVIVDPSPKDDQAPAALKMAALRFYDIKKLN